MKKLYFGIAVLAALSLASCKKEQNISAPEKNLVTVTLVADKAGDETKAAAVEEESKVTYEWTEADKSNLKLFAVTIGSDDKEVLTEVEDPTIDVSSDNKILTITATVEENTTLRAVVAGELTNTTNKPKIKVTQSPATDNFDPNTDVLVADDVIVSGENELVLTFRRQAVVAKMTLKNMVAGEKVNKVVISSESFLTGYYDYVDAKMLGQNKEITLKYEDVEVGSNKEFPVYFVAMPNKGHTLTVTVKTDQFNYTKTFGNGAIDFTLGGFARFGVNMSGCGEPVDDTDYTGDWVITGANGSNVYAMLAYAGGNNTGALGVKLDADAEEIVSSKVDEIKMHFEKVAEGDYAGFYTIADVNGKYFYAASASANQMKADNPATMSADYYWAVTQEADGTYSIIAEKSNNRNVMRFNPGNSIFSCYTSGQNALTLYPYSWVVEATVIEPSGDGTLESPYNVAAAIAYTESLGSATSADYIYIQGIISSIANNGTYGSYGNATFYISDDGEASSPQFEAYRIKYLGNVNWQSGQTNIKVGDEVILCGKVKMFNGQAEISQDGYLYSLNGTTGDEQYTITVASSENGSVVASATAAKKGTEITLTITPDAGYVLDALTVVDASNNAVTVSNNKFTMPAANVTVTATFKEKPAGATTATIKFGSSDVKINAASVTGNDDQGNTWTITTEGTSSYTGNAAYYQVGSGNKPAASITFTTTLPEGTAKVDALSIKLGGFSGTAGDVTLDVDETTIGEGSLNGTSDVTVSSTTSANGRTITITVDNIAKGVKVYNIVAEYE